MNYFNYFTEVEEHFQQARGTGLFLLSPLDWAMIEIWKDSGVPLEAVHKGIDRTFEKWRARKRKTRMINSLAYCAQEVLTAAREMSDVTEGGEQPSGAAEPPFRNEDLAAYFRRNAETIRKAAEKAPAAAAKTYEETAKSLSQLAEAADAGQLGSLEAIEQRLAVLEERLLSVVKQQLGEEDLLEARQEMERQLAPYRRGMTVEQLSLLEKQYLERKHLESAGLPRLSLFYL